MTRLRRNALMIAVASASAIFATGCLRENPLYCASDADCDDDPSRTYCDVDGETEASGGIRNTCVSAPLGDAGAETDAAGPDSDGTATDARPSATRVTHVAAGGSHTCVLLDTMTVRCWGAGGFGRLGYADTMTIGDDESAGVAGDIELGGAAVSLAAGQDHACALLANGSVRCWGRGGLGQLGYGTTENIGDGETPSTAGDVPIGATVTQVAAGRDHTCALIETGAVRCWGLGTLGRLGYGNTSTIGDTETPATAGDVVVGGIVTQIAAGDGHTCALLSTGNVRCWGNNAFGELGYPGTGDIGDDELPSAAGDVDVGGIVSQVSAGGNHTCARLETGTIRCWGAGNLGSLGYGNKNNIGDNETPASAGDVPALGGIATEVAAGESHTCARFDTGATKCWGFGRDGRLGYGNEDWIGDDEPPLGAVDVGGPVEQVSAGYAHTCATLDGGSVRCWGYGQYGQLGYGNVENIGDDETPSSVGDVPLF
jgi:alpha-tubulin suppressor-like RCC1 family protein